MEDKALFYTAEAASERGLPWLPRLLYWFLRTEPQSTSLILQ